MSAPAVAYSVLVVDDEESIRSVLQRAFERRGWRVSTAENAEVALADISAGLFDACLVDWQLPGMDGLKLLAALRAHDEDVSLIMMSGQADVATAVAAMHAGAETMLVKPVDLEHMLLVVQRAAEKAQLRRLNRVLADRDTPTSSFDSLGDSPAMRELATQLTLLADGAAPVLITGETGSGKGLAAKLVHAASPRAMGPFVSVNCAGLSATFLDSELFGHERGAYTDAKTRKLGLFEVAHGGTLMLDEIGDLADELQPKLLTVLETQRFRRLGGTQELQVDVRVIAATHVDLSAAVQAGRFREDLFYRLAVLPVRMPALRERGPAAIAQLAHQMLDDLRRSIGRGPKRLSDEAMAALVRYKWPGNVRELRNVLERALVLAGPVDALPIESLPQEISGTMRQMVQPPAPQSEDLTLRTAQQRHVERVMSLASGNRHQAAKLLGVSRQTLYNYLPSQQSKNTPDSKN